MIYFLYQTLAKSLIEAQEEVHLHQLGIKGCANSLLGIELKNWEEKKLLWIVEIRKRLCQISVMSQNECVSVSVSHNLFE